MLVIGSQCVKKMSQDLGYAWERRFPIEFSSQWYINVVKVLSFRFQQCFDPFTLLLVEGSSQTGLLDIYLTKFLRIRKFKNTSAQRVFFFNEIGQNQF